MIKHTLHYLWGKKFFILLLALVLILLPNTIGHDLQVRSTTVITAMTIERTGDEIQITAQKFKPSAGSDSLESETVTYQGTKVREMLDAVSLAHCTAIYFNGEPDLTILHDLYHYRDLRGNTTVNDSATMNELLKNQDDYD
ncbi:MAG: hypothetical protein NC133_00905 [Prevotella sp.]|nr:hypothetical protein [Prevotella sp.]